jgi:hypothetical protein
LSDGISSAPAEVLQHPAKRRGANWSDLIQHSIPAAYADTRSIYGGNLLPTCSTTTRIPDTVTRFHGNAEYALEVMTNKSIAFVHNRLMNDPFDPYFFIETEFANRAEFLRWVERYHPAKLRLVKKNAPYAGFAAGFNRVKNAFDERRQSTYLFSTSVDYEGIHPKDNLYMWGHYGLGHRGIALEFDASNLARSLLAHGDPVSRLKFKIADVWVKVDYKTQITPLSHLAYLDFILSGPPSDDSSESPGLGGITSFLNQTLKTKHTVWSMESEWRLLWSNDSGANVYHCPISENSVVGIYLGLRIDDAVKERLLSSVKSRMPSVPVLQAEKVKGNFALKWVKIS